MYYKIEVKDFVRIPPEKFKLDLEDAMISEIKDKYEGHISKNIGHVVDVSEVGDIGDGKIIPGDGANFYEATFTLLTFVPEQKEVMKGVVRDIADFGAFINMGPADGMVHISQTMNDFVSFSTDKVLQGRDSNKVLKIDDQCRARIISLSYKDISNPKIGLTMRQEGLGKEEWVQNDLNKGEKKEDE